MVAYYSYIKNNLFNIKLLNYLKHVENLFIPAEVKLKQTLPY